MIRDSFYNLAVSFLLGTLGGCGSYTTIHVRVTDAITAQPIANAEALDVRDAEAYGKDETLVKMGSSDSDGMLVLRDLYSRERHIINIRKSGYKTATIALLRDSDTIEVQTNPESPTQQIFGTKATDPIPLHLMPLKAK